MKSINYKVMFTALILCATVMSPVESVKAKALKKEGIPVFNVFELGIQPDKTTAYDTVGENNIRQSIANEPGTSAMFSVKNKENPNIAYMIEVYADDAAYQKHLASSQYKAFIAQSPEILTDHKKRMALNAQYLGDKATPIAQREEMITNMVRITVHPEEAAAFKAVVMPEMVQSLAMEDGVLAIYAGTLADDPDTWLFFEIYASEAAYQAHRQTPHFQEYLRLSADMLGEKTFYPIRPSLLQNKGGLNFNSME